jgi:hypothetical protein
VKVPRETLKIADIKIGKRHRKDMGDIDALSKSIEEQDLLQPIGVTEGMVLVFGQRRIEACKKLGWSEIDARIVNVTSIVEGEWAENEIRKAFTLEERVYVGRAIEQEIGNRAGRPRATDNSGISAGISKGTETRDHAATLAGFGSATNYRYAKEIVEAAEKAPKKYQEPLDHMNRTGKVGGAHKKLREIKNVNKPKKGKIAPDVLKEIQGTDVEGNETQLKALEEANFDDQRHAMRMVSLGFAKDVRECLGPSERESDKRVDALMNAWKKADDRARSIFLAWLERLKEQGSAEAA